MIHWRAITRTWICLTEFHRTTLLLQARAPAAMGDEAEAEPEPPYVASLAFSFDFTPVPPPAILAEAEDVEEQADVTLDAENALLKSIEESKMVAEGEEEPEEE